MSEILEIRSELGSLGRLYTDLAARMENLEGKVATLAKVMSTLQDAMTLLEKNWE